MDITLESVTGGKEAVLTALAINPNFSGARVRGEERTSIMAVGVAHELAKEKLRGDMVEALAIRLDAFTLLNGERPAQEADEWDEALSDEVSGTLEPYNAVLSSDWLYPHVDDSQLHRPGEIQTFAQSFAQEVWKQLTFKRTTAQILAGIGIVDGDILKFLQAYKPPKKEELHNVSQLNAVLNRIILNFPDEFALEEDLDNASDTDDTLSSTGAEALGISTPEALVLRRERAAGQTVEAWVDLIVAGEILPVDPLELPAALDRSLQTEALAKPAQPPPTAPAVPPITEAAPPGTVGRKRAHAAAAPPAGAVPQAALLALKSFGNIKDDDLATMFGVSRPTMNNYMRGKGHCVPTPAQRATLLAFIDKHLTGLTEARNTIAI